MRTLDIKEDDMVSVNDILSKYFTKQNLIKLVIGLITAWVAWVYASTWWTMDTYTVEVTRSTYDKDGQWFINVKPMEDGFNTDNSGTYKVEIRDIRLPGLAWATHSERLDGLAKGDVVCLTDVGYRNTVLTWYPNAIKYTVGPCTE